MRRAISDDLGVTRFTGVLLWSHRDLVGRRQPVGVVERGDLEPEDVEVDLVAGDEVGVGKSVEPIGLDSFEAARRLVAGDEIVKVGVRSTTIMFETTPKFLLGDGN
jgi:hypothetical protein